MTREATSIINSIIAARRVSVPLIAVTTPDPGAVVEAVRDKLTGEHGVTESGEPIVKLSWDCNTGISPLDADSKSVATDIKGEFDNTIGNPVEAINQVRSKLGDGGILIMHMMPRFLDSPLVIQAVWNLRDRFKQNQRTLIMLATGSINLPPELAGDVVVFDEPLPDENAIHEIIIDTYCSADMAIPPGNSDTVQRSIEALTGLPAFQAEQVFAMSLTPEGPDLDALWERKRRQIELTPGLKVHRDGVKFDGIGGVDVVKDFIGRILRGKHKPNAVVFIDEIEKMISGAGSSGGDTSGVSQDQLGSLLSYMQDHNAAGMIFIGPPGSAKSMVAKAAGNEAGIPTIQLDLGGLKGSLVGESEQHMRSALKVITSVSNDRSLWIATCNSIGELPPELRRRFTLGTFFFDLPTREERIAIWEIYTCSRGGVGGVGLPLNEYGPLPDDTNWTGAEIRQCCDIASRLGVTLKEAAQFVVPIARSASEQIERLRTQANGRFLSASRPGVYQQEEQESKSGTSGGGRRRMKVA